jgi:hypothetical protein
MITVLGTAVAVAGALLPVVVGGVLAAGLSSSITVAPTGRQAIAP